ncbi:MAG: hypothetical protein LRY66_01020, partial [Saccharospirillaceae bacterium]|nr:hypothetical protein [Saccharospirillaceae bacterium]
DSTYPASTVWERLSAAISAMDVVFDYLQPSILNQVSFEERILSVTKSEDSTYLANTVWERLSAAIFARFAFVLARFVRG